MSDEAKAAARQEHEPEMEFIGGGPVYPGAPVITCACGNAHACAAAETGPVTDAEVEAALHAWHLNLVPFEADFEQQDHYDMRAALEAARKVREGK